MGNLKFWLWLTLSGKPATERIVKVLNYFETPEKAFTAKRKEYEKIEGLRLPDIDLFCNKSLDEANRVLEYCQNQGIRIITAFDEEYPSRLKHIFPKPLLLYVKGKIPVETEKFSISIVGTRNFSSYGASVCEKLAGDLARCGFVIVSGMARGIDTVAHTATLRARGKTVAVLGSGVDYIYPYENKLLYEEIVSSGAVISEFMPRSKPDASNFPIRNRIISGMTLGTIVVESAEKGGSMITARLASEQGRDVFAVPGMVNSEISKGTNELIKQGAKLVTTASDILEEYADISDFKILRYDESGSQLPQKEYKTVASSAVPYLHKQKFDAEKGEIYNLISHTPIHTSEIYSKAKMPPEKISELLLMLEMEDEIISLSGGFYKIRD
jgi:DNA processing protein